MKKISIKYLVFVLLCCVMGKLSAQERILLTGRVWADDDKAGLVAVTVVELDKNGRIYSSAMTDLNGNFSLRAKSQANSLQFSYVGYKKVVIPIGDRNYFDVKMESEMQLDEVVVQAQRTVSTGAMPISEREFSGSMQRFSMDEIVGISVPSVDDALQGRIAGLDIVMNSGDLGSGSVMRVRGVTSINSNSQPLILLNNIPYESHIDASFDFASADQEKFASLLSISPDDIQEITVLKDGAACAIWGARGANGIINITTKKGVTGPTRTFYSYRLSGSKQPKGTPLLDGDEYTMLMKQAYFNRNQEDCNIPEYSYDRSQFAAAYGTAEDFENFNNNTNWVDSVSQIGWTHDHVLSITGGGERARFRASMGYYNQTGTVIGQELNRFSGLMNLDYNVSSRLKFITEFSITYTDNDKNYSDSDGDNLLNIAYKKMPNTGIYRQGLDGENTDTYFNIAQNSQLNDDQKNLRNPVAIARLATWKQSNMRIMPTLRLQYDLLDPSENYLRYQGYVKFDSENMKDKKFLPRETTSKNWNDGSVNKSYHKESEAMTILMDHNLTWMPHFDDPDVHSLMLYASWQMDVSHNKYQEFERYGLPSTSATDISSLGHLSGFGSAETHGRNMAFLLSGHYLFRDRYVLDFSTRWDGSSRFGPENRWGLFPALSGKWIISAEEFMQPSEHWLSELSLRAGWGVTGNRPDYEYLYYSRYNSFGTNYTDIPSIKPSSLQLSNLKWERSSSYNLGMEISLMDYRYRLVANAYHRRTENLLFRNQTIPSSTGFPNIAYINAGTMDNNGWELEFSTNRMIKTGDWQFDVSLNLSNYRNNIVSLDENVMNSYNKDFTYTNGTYLTRLQEDNSFGSIYGFRYKGVYQYDEYQADKPDATAPVVRDEYGNVVFDAKGKTIPMYYAYGTANAYRFRGGDAIYEDINHDGTIDELDIVYLGNSNPKLDGGFGFTLRYKRFMLTPFFNFRLGSKIINYGRIYAENMYSTDNQSVSTNWRWRKDGDLTMIPRALYQSGYNWLGSDRFVENGSFLRMKQLTLNYSLSQKDLKRIACHSMSFSLTLNNIFTLSKYTGADPEVSPNSIGIAEDWNRTPRSRYFTFAFNIGI
ncbi:MAG: SusC/RagA family TonB-linked outer membrane protein [Bacteroidales bacterium]|nr:SusC/RagA family TonB-linked outer membrane protein [Bacteroidales bacterium]